MPDRSVSPMRSFPTTVILLLAAVATAIVATLLVDTARSHRASHKGGPREAPGRMPERPGRIPAVTEGKGPSKADAPRESEPDAVRSLPEWLEKALQPDEERARAEFLASLQNTHTPSGPGNPLQRPNSYLFPLNDLRARPEAYSIFMPDEGRPMERRWGVLTKVNVLFEEPNIGVREKEEIGRAFLRVVAADPSSLGAESVATLGLRVQSLVASVEEARELRILLGESFSEAQARRVAEDLSGLVTRQAYVNKVAAMSLAPQFKPHEHEAIASALEEAAAVKMRTLVGILTPEQLAHLYGTLEYDRPAYWRRRVAEGG